MKSAIALCGVLALAACAAPPARDTPTRAAVIADTTLPPMKQFARPDPRPPVASNLNISDDFLDLHFELESGRELPVFTRFETPITVRVTGSPPTQLGTDLSKLLTRLRSEAQIDIRQVPRAQRANITIQAVTRKEIRRALPQAACFVVPNVDSLAQFRRDRRKDSTNWALLRERQQMAIFLPYDASPQEVRDCLHEELAQAIGPLNDLYRLPDSVFNDDNVHTVLTGFDMLILRATYAPELTSGMTRDQVAARLPVILNRENPRGAGRARTAVVATPRSWINAVQAALGPGSSPATRRSAANAALQIALQLGWQDHRRAFSHYVLGRMVQFRDPLLAQQHFQTALRFLSRTPGAQLHKAYVSTQTIAFEISQGDGAEALRQIEPGLRDAARAENAALLATLMLLKSEALGLQGRAAEARAVRVDSLGWARYGFGADWAVRAKMQEIATLRPTTTEPGTRTR
ncbi:MAG: DUF2927 domain-containing protein [Pseudomonadota bacterium]